MEREDVRRTIFGIAEEVFELDPGELLETADLESDLGATSLMLTEFAVAIERRFEITLDPAELEDARRVADVIGLVARTLERTTA
jgi:acyl carrier protein